MYDLVKQKYFCGRKLSQVENFLPQSRKLISALGQAVSSVSH